MTYNKTQLNPETTFERHVYHRDQFAHYLRWTHVLKIARIGMNILDFGCGSGSLAEVLYRNKYKANKYLGLDVREQTINKANQKYANVDWVSFKQADLCNPLLCRTDEEWDIIACFEVFEHIGKQNGRAFLENIKNNMTEKTVLLLSTPVYDPYVGAAANHIIDGEIGEYGFNELLVILREHFIIDRVFGTFASQKDYKNHMNDWQKKMYESLKSYYDSNLVSNIMAPLFPEHSRNCIWKLRLK